MAEFSINLDQICSRCQKRLSLDTKTILIANNNDESSSSNSKRLKLETNLAQSSNSDDTILPVKQNKKFSCSICLDILNPNFINKIATEVMLSLQRENYDVTSFSVSTHIPFSIWLNEYLISLATGNEYNLVMSKLSLKRDLRMFYAEEIQNFSGLNFKPYCGFEITIKLIHSDADRCLIDYNNGLCPTSIKIGNRYNHVDGNTGITFALIESLICQTSLEYFSKLKLFPIPLYNEQCSLSNISFTNTSLYLAGRYNKYSRNISQTPWNLDGTRENIISVEESISKPILEMFKSDDLRFMAAGREDIDVMMLGNGRPFLIELVNPRQMNSIEKCNELEKNINSLRKEVQVCNLAFVSKAKTDEIKKVDGKNKNYRALIITRKLFTDKHLAIIDATKNLRLNQKTPIRVLHRRSSAIREKTIYSLSAKLRNSTHLDLFLTTQSGTYIKEFVHGDLGRTQPNLRTILELPNLDIVELDVLNVDFNWP